MTEAVRCLRSGLLAYLVLSLGFGSVARAGELATLLEFNPESTRQELLARRRFHPVFMGIKEREGHATELLALRILLDDPTRGIACERLRNGLSARGEESAAAREQEIAALKEWMDREKQGEGFTGQYLAYRGPGGSIDPDFFIFTSMHAQVAAMYGEVVFEIRERTPRGVDLNSLNRELGGFYDALSWSERLNPRQLVIRNLVDRDEYVIPSHIPNQEVVAVDIRARLPNLMPSQMVRMTGRVQRRYLRGREGEARWVDLVDRSGRLMARFGTDASVPDPTAPRSSRELPEELAAALAGLSIAGKPVRMLR